MTAQQLPTKTIKAIKAFFPQISIAQIRELNNEHSLSDAVTIIEGDDGKAIRSLRATLKNYVIGEVKAKKAIAKEKKAKVKLKKPKYWYDKAWGEFSLWIRNRDSWTCISSGVSLGASKYVKNKAVGSLGAKDFHCGHYIEKSLLGAYSWLNFYEKNCHCQSARENIWFEGNKSAYSLGMIKRYGVGIIEELEYLRRNKNRYLNAEELEAVYNLYKDKNKRKDYGFTDITKMFGIE